MHPVIKLALHSAFAIFLFSANFACFYEMLIGHARRQMGFVCYYKPSGGCVTNGMDQNVACMQIYTGLNSQF